MVRAATKDDIPALVSMGLGFHSQADLNSVGLGYDAVSLEKYCHFLLGLEVAEIFLAEVDGEIVGSISGIIHPWFLDYGETMAIEQWWWVNPDERGKTTGIRLYEALQTWAKSMGATKMIMVGLETGNAGKMANTYKRMGFSLLESHYLKEI